MTFNVITLNRIGQLPDLTASVIDHNIDIICIQEHRYIHSEDIRYHDTGDGWTFVLVSTWKNSFNTEIGVGKLIGPQALKSLNSIEKIQPEMRVATFNGNPSTTTLPMLAKKRISSPSIKSYPLLFVASRNITLSSSVEIWMPELVKT